MSLTDKDISEIQQGDLRVSHWLSSFTQDMQERRIQKQQQDELELLTTKEYSELVDGEEAKRLIRRFSTVDANTVSTSDFVSLRDYLLVRVLVASAQRTGAASNLSVEEFNKGRWITAKERTSPDTLRIPCGTKLLKEGPPSSCGRRMCTTWRWCT